MKMPPMAPTSINIRLLFHHLFPINQPLRFSNPWYASMEIAVDRGFSTSLDGLLKCFWILLICAFVHSATHVVGTIFLHECDTTLNRGACRLLFFPTFCSGVLQFLYRIGTTPHMATFHDYGNCRSRSSDN